MQSFVFLVERPSRRDFPVSCLGPLASSYQGQQLVKLWYNLTGVYILLVHFTPLKQFFPRVPNNLVHPMSKRHR